MGKRLKKIFLLFWLTVLFAVIGVGMYVYFVPLPDQELPNPTRFLDLNGQEIPTSFAQNRLIISQEEMPQYLRDAMIAIEDYRYYNHFGFDPLGIARALWKNLQAGKVVEGGSTITQQLAKNLFLTPERTLERKLRELLLTLQLEARFTKEEILTMYLNQIYFGRGAYGLEMASYTYFGKPAKELTLAESALLVGIPRAPSRYAPTNDLEAAVERQHLILNRMAELGYISAAQAETAKREPLVLAQQNPPVSSGQYFIDYVVSQIENNYPHIAKLLNGGGLTVHTTLNQEMQKIAENLIASDLPAGQPDANGVQQPQGALVAIEPTSGYILALVGGRNYQETQYNRATALRQPGSAFKPFVYLAALENGYTLTSRIMCEEVEYTVPQTGETYRPTDYGDQPYHNRPLTLREALTISDNVVSTILNYQLGPELGIKYAQRLGIESTLHPYLSSALGTSEVTPLEMASAFAAFANGGKRVEPLAVLKITDAQGKTVLDNKPNLQQVVNPAHAYLITNVLQGVLQPGGTAASIGWRLDRPAAGKTGTSQNYGNAWFVGYTPDLVVSVWVGNDKANESVGGSGATLAAPIWVKFIQQALATTPPHDFTRPDNIVEVEICTASGLRAGNWCPEEEKTTELFVQGTEPWRNCDAHSFWDWNWDWNWDWFDQLLPPQWNQPRTIPEVTEPPRPDPAQPRRPEQLPAAEPPSFTQPERPEQSPPAEPEGEIETEGPITPPPEGITEPEEEDLQPTLGEEIEPLSPETDQENTISGENTQGEQETAAPGAGNSQPAASESQSPQPDEEQN
ncbi:MAG: PBP1A family penicillin-binding protein [bacterium]